ncbi:MAG: phosphatase PAP2 family protein [Actinomycetota bacterium]|nr:phosphatase PAP2 family protein [Actinomycetota bacterium]
MTTKSIWKILAPSKQVGGKTIRFWNQVLLIAAIYMAYEYTSSLASGSTATARHNALDEVSIERSLHFFFEQHLQAFVIQHALWLIKLSDLYYVTVHFALPVVVIVLLLVKYPERYIRWRNTMVLLNLFALVVFIVFPVMPPRLLPEVFHFVDTQKVFGGAGTFDATLMKDAGNQYAAMPSLHFAWAVWCTLAIVPVVRNRLLKVLLLAHPIITAFVVFVTANHFWLDVFMGGVDFYLAYFIAGGRHIEFWRVREPEGLAEAQVAG